jgi:hypothetical protein
MIVYKIQSGQKFREQEFIELAEKSLIGHERIAHTTVVYYKGEAMRMVGSQINTNKLYVRIYSKKQNNPRIKKRIEKANKGLIKLIRIN